MLYRIDDDSHGTPWNFSVALGDKVYPTREVTYADMEDIQRLLSGEQDFIALRVFVQGLFVKDPPDLATVKPQAFFEMIRELMIYSNRRLRSAKR